MVEVGKSTEREGTLEVVVTDVLVTGLLSLVLILEDQLEGRYSVGDAHHLGEVCG